MGGIGSDIAVENADIVIMNDDPIKIFYAIRVNVITGFFSICYHFFTIIFLVCF